jgi:hypothetical protein
VLIGRESECARLDELLDRARMGRTGALVIRGEAGIGKTALLDYAVERAEGMLVARPRRGVGGTAWSAAILGAGDPSSRRGSP